MQDKHSKHNNVNAIRMTNHIIFFSTLFLYDFSSLSVYYQNRTFPHFNAFTFNCATTTGN